MDALRAVVLEIGVCMQPCRQRRYHLAQINVAVAMHVELKEEGKVRVRAVVLELSESLEEFCSFLNGQLPMVAVLYVLKLTLDVVDVSVEGTDNRGFDVNDVRVRSL